MTAADPDTPPADPAPTPAASEPAAPLHPLAAPPVAPDALERMAAAFESIAHDSRSRNSRELWADLHSANAASQERKSRASLAFWALVLGVLIGAAAAEHDKKRAPSAAVPPPPRSRFDLVVDDDEMRKP